MTLRAVSVSFLLLAAVLLPAYGADMKCACKATGKAAGYLTNIDIHAVRARAGADSIADCLNVPFPEWQEVSDRMAPVIEDVNNLHRDLARLEGMELNLTSDQAAQFERLKAGVGTLTLFVNNVNKMLQKKAIWPRRTGFLAQIDDIEARCDVIRRAADRIRVPDAA